MKRIFPFVLALVMVLSLAACSGKDTTAAAMHLRRTEGTVTVSDSGGKDVPARDNLGLYSGYGVGTRSASYAWIDLDDVKLTKLDQNSEIAIQKEGKKLDIEVRSGSLFFNVTRPLEDDETLNITASTLLVGIRGTCGWVEAQGDTSRIYILEGKVECAAGDRTVRVNAGQMAELTADGELAAEPFDTGRIPTFVLEDLIPDLDLCDVIYGASGLNISGSVAKAAWNGHIYRVFDRHEPSWLAAEAYCESLGGHLATISSQEENDFLYQLIIEAGYTSAYFGLTDRNRDGMWTWVTGEPVVYTNWHMGEPNSMDEDCGMFYYQFADGTWNDGDFGMGRTLAGGTAFICEWDSVDR